MKKKISFIAVLPVVVACSNPMRTSNPPEPVSTSAPTTKGAALTPTTNPQPEVKKPEEPLYPPEFYSKREKKPDGKCYVQVSANPPYQVEVSCDAPIEAPINGSKWCRVQTAKEPEQKIGVDCDAPPPPPPPAYFPKREKGPTGTCYVRMAGNPPYQEEVSCTEVPKPHTNGGCLVDMKRTPEQKIVIDCKS
jgi:hypothetical protein